MKTCEPLVSPHPDNRAAIVYCQPRIPIPANFLEQLSFDDDVTAIVPGWSHEQQKWLCPETVPFKPRLRRVIEINCSAGHIDDRICFSQRTNYSGYRLNERVLGNQKRIEKSLPVLWGFLYEVHSMPAVCQSAIQINQDAVIRAT